MCDCVCVCVLYSSALQQLKSVMEAGGTIKAKDTGTCRRNASNMQSLAQRLNRCMRTLDMSGPYTCRKRTFQIENLLDSAWGKALLDISQLLQLHSKQHTFQVVQQVGAMPSTPTIRGCIQPSDNSLGPAEFQTHLCRPPRPHQLPGRECAWGVRQQSSPARTLDKAGAHTTVTKPASGSLPKMMDGMCMQ